MNRHRRPAEQAKARKRATGYTARALGHAIFTEADTLEELPRNVREAADCYFDDSAAARNLVKQLQPK